MTANKWTISVIAVIVRSCDEEIAHQNCLECFEISCWRRLQEIGWSDRVESEEISYRVKEKKDNLTSSTIKLSKIKGLVTCCVGTNFLNTLLKET